MYTYRMYKKLISLVIILACTGSNLSAAPKTWTKDPSGRVLVYRSEPSKWQAAGSMFVSLFGASGMVAGACSVFDEAKQNRNMMLCGTLISACGIYGLWQWHYNYTSLFKPLIIIDKSGIIYEGKDKILWKKVCSYREMVLRSYNNGVEVSHENYLEISTDINTLEIYERDIAISLPMLYKLIDEAYKSYEELEKERAAA